MYNKTIIEFGFCMISWIIKTSCLYYLPQPSASADNTDLGFDNSWYHAQSHPIIVYYIPLFTLLPNLDIHEQLEYFMIAYWMCYSVSILKNRSEHVSKQQNTNHHWCLWFKEFPTPNWLFPCNTITFQKYFWYFWDPSFTVITNRQKKLCGLTEVWEVQD